ncbi:hypothetical protein KUTeg_020035 [Tegillarca granosa]|uniref:Hydantoinase n=1 Tax=Tegillarca granosa TaxID=220873 RepID=A0ABQ9EE99_TEGGR|nr:hypothetical protein KUTeg_020035 [Tegillarca granosa]
MNLKCPFYLTHNDGTILSCDRAIEYPVFTFASGPTNSMRGSALLSGLSDAIVVDIGGTTTDIGLLSKGFPREASAEVKIGGVRTSFQMPDVISIGLGGGSYVSIGRDHIMIGPSSSGFRLKEEAQIFKEDILETSNKGILTATDIAVAAGFCQLGNPKNVKHLLPEIVSSATTKIREMIEIKIDQVKLDSTNLPVIVVGGGNILLDSNVALKGSTRILKPTFSDVANAVGAALCQVSGSVDYIANLFDKLDESNMNDETETAIKNLERKCSLDEKEGVKSSIRKRYLEKARDMTISEACKFATDLAVKFGANPSTISVIEQSDTPLSYLPGNATRVRVKVIGDLNFDKEIFVIREFLENKIQHAEDVFCPLHKQEMTVFGQPLSKTQHEKTTLFDYEPCINEKGEWILSVLDINCIAIGTGVLGCGGGGSPYLGRLLATKAIESGRKIRVITRDKICGYADDENDLIMEMGFMGSPMVVQEKLVSGRELPGALECMRDIFVHGKYKDGHIENEEGFGVKEEDGVTFIDNYNPKTSDIEKPKTDRIKNIIGLMSAEIGGLNGIEPLLLIANCMGRAFPELQMICPIIYGLDPFPSTLADEKGRRAVILKCPSPKHLENHFRRVVVEMGCSGGVVISADLASKTIHYSISRAWRLGKAVLLARECNQSPVEAITKHEGGKLLITGKIVDVLRETTVVDSDTGEPISTETVRYGMRISVLVLPIPDIMKTEQALKFVGPQAFGYPADIVYSPSGKYTEQVPVGPR